MPERYSETLNPFAGAKSDWKSLLLSEIVSLVEFTDCPEAIDYSKSYLIAIEENSKEKKIGLELKICCLTNVLPHHCHSIAK
ncbi:hypothetical protein BTVI_04155 [Pitangus sulphuratus]|nr:hypothetical protein BTVI_04155 [Pitangus sulphuratus]